MKYLTRSEGTFVGRKSRSTQRWEHGDVMIPCHATIPSTNRQKKPTSLPSCDDSRLFVYSTMRPKYTQFREKSVWTGIQYMDTKWLMPILSPGAHKPTHNLTWSPDIIKTGLFCSIAWTMLYHANRPLYTDHKCVDLASWLKQTMV